MKNLRIIGLLIGAALLLGLLNSGCASTIPNRDPSRESFPAVTGTSLLGEDVAVVSAFQNVAAAHLQDTDAVECDVLVCGNKKDARQAVIELVEAAGMRGYHAGMINNAAAAEALTSVLIVINKQYSCHAGIKITGLDAGH